MRKVFIDAGCYKGRIVEECCSKNQDFEVYAFDPSMYKREWKKLQNRFPNINFIQKAIWIEDGQIEFSDCKDVGSTIVPTNTSFNRGKRKTVESIDFSKWLKQFTKEDYIYLVMDIESAEYAVLEKMITDGTINLIDELQIEFHHTEPEINEIKRQEKIEEHFKKINLQYKVIK